MIFVDFILNHFAIHFPLHARSLQSLFIIHLHFSQMASESIYWWHMLATHVEHLAGNTVYNIQYVADDVRLDLKTTQAI